MDTMFRILRNKFQGNRLCAESFSTFTFSIDDVNTPLYTITPGAPQEGGAVLSAAGAATSRASTTSISRQSAPGHLKMEAEAAPEGAL